MQPQVGRLIEPRDVLKQRTGLRPRFGHGHDVGIPRRIASALVGDEGVVALLCEAMLTPDLLLPNRLFHLRKRQSA